MGQLTLTGDSLDSADAPHPARHHKHPPAWGSETRSRHHWESQKRNFMKHFAEYLTRAGLEPFEKLTEKQLTDPDLYDGKTGFVQYMFD